MLHGSGQLGWLGCSELIKYSYQKVFWTDTLPEIRSIAEHSVFVVGFSSEIDNI
jgi:hypothetical protein